MTNYLRRNGDNLVVDGAYSSTYLANTVDQIDANIDSIRHGQPDHPDIDRLLDARRIVGPCNVLFGSNEDFERVWGNGQDGDQL